ncbi:hypothetical protein EBR43_06120 [bacterium]|nr:hypothetical protein [bacterium]NBW57350.1 hypothetical protein [bacterium]
MSYVEQNTCAILFVDGKVKHALLFVLSFCYRSFFFRYFLRNIRDNFCHQTSHAIVSNPDTKVIIILEDLTTRNMTQSAKGDNDKPGKNVRAKAGLNRAILDKG